MASRRFRARKTLSKNMDRLSRRMRYVEKRTAKKRLNPRVVTTEKLFAKTVTTPKIADNAVTETTIAENAVGTVQIQPGAVTTAEISFDAGDIGGMASSVTTTAPSSPNIGDIWFDASDNNNLKRWNGSGWVSVRDATIAVAQSAASAAQTTADGKNKIYRQGTTPTGTFAVGDLWFDTANDNRISRWDGSSWGAYGLGNAAIANLDAGKITTGFLGAGRIAANTIDANMISANAITGVKIAGDAIDGKTITGATLQTSSAANGKIVIDSSNGFRAIASDGATTVTISTGGTASFTGGITATSFTATGLVEGGAGGDIAPNTITDTNIQSLNADKITAGTINASVISVTNLNASNITTGTINAGSIAVTNLNADNITAGTFTGIVYQSSGSNSYGKDLKIDAGSNPYLEMRDNSNDLVRLSAYDGMNLRWDNAPSAVRCVVNLTDTAHRMRLDTARNTYCLEVGGTVRTTGDMRADGSFIGSGSGLSSINASNVSGAIPTANNSSFLGGVAASGYLRSNTADSHSGGTLSVQTLSISGTISISGGFGVSSSWSPNTDNVGSVGISSRRWNAVWATDTTINASDARQKKDIEDETLGLTFINALRPRTYKWIESHKEAIVDADGNPVLDDDGNQTYRSIPGSRSHHGFISQEIRETYSAFTDDFAAWVLADKNDANSSQFLRYTEFIAPLVKAVQELSAQVVSLEAQIEEMKGQ